jgi:hypothetical protein
MAGDEDDVHELLQEKDEQLMRAAQLGQSLLARATELEQANELLREEHERASSSLEEQQYRVKELSGQSATLHQIVTAKERSVAELEQQIETARQSGYEQGVADAAVTPNGVPDGAEATADSRDQATEVELERLREQTRVLAEQEDALRAAMEAEGTGRRQAERKHKQMAEQLASSQEQLRSQTEREASIEAAREVEAEATEAERARVQELTVRLATMEEEVQRARAVLSDDALFSTMHTVMTAPPPAAPPPPPPSLAAPAALATHHQLSSRGTRALRPQGQRELVLESSEEAAEILAWLRVETATVTLGADVDLEELARNVATAMDAEDDALEPGRRGFTGQHKHAGSGRRQARIKNLVTDARLRAMRAQPRRRHVQAVDFSGAVQATFAGLNVAQLVQG